MKNKNDAPVENIDNCFLIENFKFLGEFSKLAILQPSVKNEKIIINKVLDNKYFNNNGLVYILVIDGKIIKVGSATTTMEKRVKSYNCGKQSYRNNGTCSTTNYFVLQSLLKIEKLVEVYSYFTEKIEVNVFGVTKEISVPPKVYEKQILSYLKSIGKMPLLCTQV